MPAGRRLRVRSIRGCMSARRRRSCVEHHSDARIARIACARRFCEASGDGVRDLHRGLGAPDVDRADVVLFDAAAATEHREEAASVGAMERAPGDDEPRVSLGRMKARRGSLPRLRPLALLLRPFARMLRSLSCRVLFSCGVPLAYRVLLSRRRCAGTRGPRPRRRRHDHLHVSRSCFVAAPNASKEAGHRSLGRCRREDS
jgi:hypothetical protein